MLKRLALVVRTKTKLCRARPTIVKRRLSSLGLLHNRYFLLLIWTLKLSHGQVLRVIKDTRLAEHLSDTALDAIVNKFPHEGLRFAPDEVGAYQWEEIVYRYEHIVELAVALKLLTDGMFFCHIVSLLPNYRSKLRKVYREALRESRSGRGADRTIVNPSRAKVEHAEMNIGGLYLEFMAINRNGVVGNLR